MSRRRKACAHFEASAWQAHICRRCFVTKDCHQISTSDNQLHEGNTQNGDGSSSKIGTGSQSSVDAGSVRKSDSHKDRPLPQPIEAVKTNSFARSCDVGVDYSRTDEDKSKEIKVPLLVKAVSGREPLKRLPEGEVKAKEDGDNSERNVQDQTLATVLPAGHGQLEGPRKLRSKHRTDNKKSKASGAFIFSVDKNKQLSSLPLHMSTTVLSSDSEMSDASSTNWTSSKSKLFWPMLQEKEPAAHKKEDKETLEGEGRTLTPRKSYRSQLEAAKPAKSVQQPLRQTDGQSSPSETTETVDALLEQLRNTPQATRRHAKGSRVGSLKSEIKYTPQQQYRITRRNTTNEKRSGSDLLLNVSVSTQLSKASEKQHSMKKKIPDAEKLRDSMTIEDQPDGGDRTSKSDNCEEGPASPNAKKMDTSISPERQQSTRFSPECQQSAVEGNMTECHQTAISVVPNQPSTELERRSSYSSRVSTLDFVTTQLAFIAEAWSQEDVENDIPQQVSLQDLRLVENIAAADWCDGTSGVPLWKQNHSPAGRLPCEATFPVVCVHSQLKQPDRIYCLRVGVNSHRGMDEADQAYARFKTDYRVLERLSPHPNVLRVLAHFRDSVPPVLGDGGTSPNTPNDSGIPHAIFVLSSHLPLLNARMYLRKCEELLSVEGYERCVALLLFQLLDGLKHLHREGAIHCNLTQDNLLIVPTMHPGGGDRLVISNFGDAIYYSGPPPQFTLTPEQATKMVCQGKGWNRRCQPPDLRMSSMLPANAVIDLQFCDIFRVGTLLYDMLGLESAVGKFVTKVESLLCSGTAPDEVDIAPPRVPLESCFSQPLHRLGSHLIHPNPKKRLEVGQALCVVGAMLWGPTLGHSGLLGLESGITAKMWLKRRRLELLAELAGAYSLPNGLQAGGFALADELHCRFLAQAHPDVLEECLAVLQK